MDHLLELGKAGTGSAPTISTDKSTQLHCAWSSAVLIITGSVKYKHSGGTAKPAHHLRTRHLKQLELGVPALSPIISGLINTAKQFNTQHFSQKVADDLLLLWMIHANIPFSMTSDNGFQALMHYINDTNRIPRSPSSIRDRIVTRFQLLQPHDAELMRQADTQIHLCCDVWTSPHQTMAIRGIIAHFISKSGMRMNPVIGL